MADTELRQAERDFNNEATDANAARLLRLQARSGLMFKTSDFQFRQKVLYVPHHANDDLNHPDVISGQVSSTNERWVFVRFDKQIAKLGWDGTTSQACSPDQLRKVK